MADGMDPQSFVLSDPKYDLIDLKWNPLLSIMWGQNWSTCFFLNHKCLSKQTLEIFVLICYFSNLFRDKIHWYSRTGRILACLTLKRCFFLIIYRISTVPQNYVVMQISQTTWQQAFELLFSTFSTLINIRLFFNIERSYLS